ncbi:fgf [Cyclophragma undans nucleopolyhedrovirus]|uniref:Fgf n=1 Tax=Cyclophragma undans nucleopolyhedrovirus TaxID=1906244 RepID=A0A288QAC3_9ABAC|nr:fgf [Cyclophragma undans nucleopolyhedrovirus]AOT85575.1 fgf [Cyclophragma undans nucleopolyhedrovirus]
MHQLRTVVVSIPALLLLLLLCIWPPSVHCSAKLTHITGTAKPIHMVINRRYLQVLPDATVNGTREFNNVHTLMRRIAIDRKHVVIQNVLTCMFVCMDTCGQLYGSSVATKDCKFKEKLEHNNYNSYSRIHNKKRGYIALDNSGGPRRLQIHVGRTLRQLSRYALTIINPIEFDLYSVCAAVKTTTGPHRAC